MKLSTVLAVTAAMLMGGFGASPAVAQDGENHAPELTAAYPYIVVSEGDVAYMRGTFSDPDGDPVTLSAQWDDPPVPIGYVAQTSPTTWEWYAPEASFPPDWYYEAASVHVRADDGTATTTVSFGVYAGGHAAAAGSCLGDLVEADRAKLTQPYDPADPSGDEFGHSIALGMLDSLTRVAVIGAPNEDGAEPSAGAVFLCTNDGGTEWDLEAVLTADDGGTGDRFGHAVAIEGGLVAVGAPHASAAGVETGAVYVFDRSSGSWGQTAKILANDGDPGDRLGSAVAIRFEEIFAGADGDDERGVDAGAAYVFAWDGYLWGQHQKLVASDPIGYAAGDRFGFSLDVDVHPHGTGDLIVGAPYDDPAAGFTDIGAAYVFDRAGPPIQYLQTDKLVAGGLTGGERYGYSVGISDSQLVVGAPLHGAGAVYTYRPTGVSDWIESELTDPGPEPGDRFGEAVAIDDYRIAVGEPGDDGRGTNAGSVHVFAYTAIGWYDVAEFTDPSAQFGDLLGSAVGVMTGPYAMAAAGAPMDRAGSVQAINGGFWPPDVVPPEVTVPEDITLEATGPSGAVAEFVATAEDDEDGDLIPSCDPAPGTVFPVGDTTVTCSATDAAGNTGTASFLVSVVDTTPPVVTVPADMTVEATGPGGAVVTYAASAVDLVDGAMTPVCAPVSGATFPVGETTVTCSATDTSWNTASESFAVSVTDTTGPVVTVPADMTVEATGPGGAVVTYAASAVDLVDGAMTPVCAPVSGVTFPIGETTVTCSATDTAGNTASESFAVSVTDTTGPVVTVPADMTVEATGPGGAMVSFTAAAEDVVDGSVPVVCAPGSGSLFPIGSTTVTCSATDTAGNQGSQSLLVDVVDSTPPVVTVPAAMTVGAGPGGAVVTYAASAVDLVDGAMTPVCAPVSGATFPVGETTVTCSATDTAGNTASESFAVSVIDATLPIADPGGPYQVRLGNVADFDGTGSFVPQGSSLDFAWTFGDGVTGTGAEPSHLYAATRLYEVCLTVVADPGGASDTACTTAAVYDPDGGFVTGGGWITVPAGSSPSAPQAAGQATFGFVARYKKGTDQARGSLEFDFEAAGIEFRSTGHDWLVVSDDGAKWQGVGTVNGAGNYGFMATATETDRSDGSAGSFRIKIWDLDDDGRVVFDSRADQSDVSYLGNDLGGGSIAIHKL